MIIKNGDVVARLNEQEVTYPIDAPGTYRVQVRASPMLPLAGREKMDHVDLHESFLYKTLVFIFYFNR